MSPFFSLGAPGEIRTPDLLVRSQTLYPTELRAHRLSAACGRGAAHFTLGSRPICKKQAARSVPKLPQDGVSGWRHCGARSMTVESSVSFSANDAHRPPVAWPCLASTSKHASTTASTWRPGCFFNSSTAAEPPRAVVRYRARTWLRRRPRPIRCAIRAGCQATQRQVVNAVGWRRLRCRSSDPERARATSNTRGTVSARRRARGVVAGYARTQG
jgi:hypothetical protein